ncbi:hypothetical protein BH23THE1_BH23THE1_28420 [soil metagenome]
MLLILFTPTVATYSNAIFPCCFDMEIESTGFVQALVYSSLLYNENNSLILQFCPVCPASSPQSGFSSKRNGCCIQCSRT